MSISRPGFAVLGLGIGPTIAPFFDIFAIADRHVAAGPATAFVTTLGVVLWVLIGLTALTFVLAFLLPPRAREEAPGGAAAQPAQALPA